MPNVDLDKFNIIQATVAETLASFFFMLAFMALMIDRKAPKGIFGFGVGSAYAIGVMTLSSFTKGSLNPFKWLAPTLVSLDFENILQGVIYVVGPIIGSLLAASLYTVLFLNTKTREEIEREK